MTTMNNPADTQRTDSKRTSGPSKLEAKTNTNVPSGYVPLPAVPKSKSPVPWLTSIHATPGRGAYGTASYRGNCSGLLIRDLVQYYRPKRVLDPMTGGGTCPDVCRELGVDCVGNDIRRGFDATDPASYQGLGLFDLVWLHPPYWKMIQWSHDPRCLANAPTLEEFQRRLLALLKCCRDVLTHSGVVCVLMGDYRDKGRYLALPFRTYAAAVSAGLELAAPEIIRFSHGTTSAAEKKYLVSIIPRVHDVCLVLRRAR